jgi:ABC-type Zn uptake system ZnuABC Zn-binding protein ZnuA
MPRRLVLTATAAALGATLLLGACSSDSSSADADDPRPLVATTVSPITSIASAIGGDRIRIEGIVPEGTNSHTFEPEPRTAELLSSADLVLVNGLKLEDPTIELADANMSENAKLVEIGTVVLPESDYLYDFSFPEEEGKPNPHLWTDPTYAVRYAEVIRDEFIALDPDSADYYNANFEAFRAKADELAAAVRVDQQTVPEGNLKLVTYHDAYAYFAKNFGWQVVGAVQPEDFADPAPAEVAELIEQIKAEGVPTIFGSEVFPSSVLEEIGSAAGVRYEESLRDDDLPGAPGDSDHSWLGLMKYNFATMIRGLGGDPSTIESISVDLEVPDTATYPQ